MTMARVCDCPPNQRGAGGLWVHRPSCQHYSGEVTVEALKGELAELRAENVKLQAAAQGWEDESTLLACDNAFLAAEVTRLQASTAGLVGALESIASNDTFGACGRLIQIARHALAAFRDATKGGTT